MENQIWLQQVGYKPAVKAETLKVGDVLMWNWGYTSTITNIIKVSAKSILFEAKSNCYPLRNGLLLHPLRKQYAL